MNYYKRLSSRQIKIRKLDTHRRHDLLFDDSHIIKNRSYLNNHNKQIITNTNNGNITTEDDKVQNFQESKKQQQKEYGFH